MNQATFKSLLSDKVINYLKRRIELQDESIQLQDLAIVKSLGSGMFGNVYLTIHRTKKALYALKSVLRAKVDEHSIHDNIVNERQILL
jgi:serine/threonine protein kinase